MIDRDRVLARLDDLDRYVTELRQIAPASLDEYRQSVEKRRASERLLQIAVESVLDVCGLLVVGLRLGLPGEEDDLFEKLEGADVISRASGQRLRRMRAFRNILVHEYTRIDDAIAFEVIAARLDDFDEFRQEIVQFLRRDPSQ